MAELDKIRAEIGRCPTGDAVVTRAGNLPAKHVIHAVGPIYRDGTRGEPDLLASCYRTSLKLAQEHGAETVSFPSISTHRLRGTYLSYTLQKTLSDQGCSRMPERSGTWERFSLRPLGTWVPGRDSSVLAGSPRGVRASAPRGRPRPRSPPQRASAP